MTSFSEVLDLARTARDALNALEDTSREHMFSHFGKFENGLMSYGELRVEILRQARAGFLSSGVLANEHIKSLATRASLPEIKLPLLHTAPVLEGVLKDIQKNLEVFRDSERNETSLRRLRFRSWLSVQAAVRRGFTENQLASARALKAQGAALHKVWLANFNNNTPCATCRALHGVEVELEEEFPHGDSKSPRVFFGLFGPHRHPNCKCFMLIFVVTLEDTSFVPEPPIVTEEKFMTSRDVRRLPRAVYRAVLATLRLIAGVLKKAFHVNR